MSISTDSGGRVLRVLSWVTIREMIAKKLIYFLALLALIVAGGLTGLGVYEVVYEETSLAPAALQGQIGELLGRGLSMWFSLTTLFAVVYAAAIVKNDWKPAILHDIMVRPVAPWEYLAGKWLGLLLFFSIFVSVGLSIVLGFMVYWSIPVNTSFGAGLLYNIVNLIVFTGLSMVLSMVISPVRGGILAFVLMSFRSLAMQVPDSSTILIKVPAYVVYYLAPAQIEQDLLLQGLEGSSFPLEWLLYGGIVAENIFYAGIVLLLGAIALRKMDLT